MITRASTTLYQKRKTSRRRKKQTRAKTSDGMVKRIMRMASEVFAISPIEIAKTYGLTQRQAYRYIDRLEREGLVYLRYKSEANGYGYYSVVRRKDEVRKVQ